MKYMYLAKFGSYIAVDADNADEGYQKVLERINSMTGDEALDIIRCSCYEVEEAGWMYDEDEA